MITPALRYLVPLRRPALVAILLATFLVFWLCLLPARTVALPAGQRVLLVAACVLMAVFAGTQIGTLRTAAAVLTRRRAPEALWRNMMQAAMLQMALGWALLTAATGFFFIGAQGALHPLLAPAVLSLTGCAAMLCGLAPVRWRGYLELAVPLAVLVAYERLGGATPILDSLATLGSVPLAALGLLWPCAIALLARSWNRTGTAARWVEQTPPARPFSGLRAQCRRISFVPWPGARGDDQARLGAATGWIWPFICAPGIPLLWNGASPLGVNDLIGTRGIPLSVMLVTCALPAIDVHWRTMLAPGKWRAGRIGLRLWSSTFVVYGLVLSLTELLIAVLGSVLAHQPLHAPEPMTLATGFAKLAFVTSAAVLVRALPRRVRGWVIGLAIAAFIGWFYVLLRHYNLPWLATPTARMVYLCVLALGTPLCLIWANRVWRTETLLAAVRR